MRRCLVAAAALLIVSAAFAQNQPRQPAKDAPGVAPARPYKPVAVTPAKTSGDASLTAFRDQLGEVARKRDRAALARLVVAQGFFWDRENGNAANKKKSGLDNLAAALGLDNKDGAGWDMLAESAGDPTVSPSNEHKCALCSPADPAYDKKELNEVIAATQTDSPDWNYTLSNGLEVRAAPNENAAVVEKLGQHFVRILPAQGPGIAAYLRIVTPSGKIGYVAADSLAPVGNDQICYVKDGNGWKVGGYVGGGEPQ
jgi:hypothetical protein